ncbi:hypothetical protein BCR36DRAFT_413998 [Piromyces finnis]|uniref:MARVEL domain-containing protein n=1 Tax=Piromyces finnis TaxID=1754191 RepID=A0A1Y1V3Y8_9FUNG|nr:hypothetical protein BCR36DRAFT_413998 [Piromyces finnis]|eukprot:ORX46694.1 hypothetical protein BCR36DRAFT_413998 [Piromyces finnis]
MIFNQRRVIPITVLLSLIEFVYGQTYKTPTFGVGWGTLLLTISFFIIAAIWLLTICSNNFSNILVYTSIFYITLFLFLISIPTKPISDKNEKSNSNDIIDRYYSRRIIFIIVISIGCLIGLYFIFQLLLLTSISATKNQEI